MGISALLVVGFHSNLEHNQYHLVTLVREHKQIICGMLGQAKKLNIKAILCLYIYSDKLANQQFVSNYFCCMCVSQDEGMSHSELSSQHLSYTTFVTIGRGEGKTAPTCY